MITEFLFRNYLQEDEQIFIVLRRHPFFLLWKFIKITFFGMVLPYFLWVLFPQLWLFALIWGWFGLKIFAYGVIKWYYACWLITDTSIIVVDWKSFFNKTSTRVEYHYTDEISYEINGFLPTIFNYGIITLIRGSGQPLIFNATWQPKKKVEGMLKFQDQFITKKNMRDHKNLKEMLSDMLYLHQSHEKKAVDE